MFPFLAGKIEVVRCCYQSHSSQSDIPEFINDIRASEDRRLWIVHTGRIYRGARSPEALLRALAKLREEYFDIDAKIAVWLVGEVDSETRDQIKKWQLDSVVRVIPWVPQDEAQRWMKAADWLLLIGNYGGVQVPSKLYEYLSLRKPILLLHEVPDDEAAQIVASVDAGWILDNNEESIAQFFRSFFKHSVQFPGYRGAVKVETYSAEAALERYWRFIQRIVSY
jgi:glycosyltransferase involved in cell wall biosynthesis